MLYATGPSSLWSAWADTAMSMTKSALDIGSAMTETAVAMIASPFPTTGKASATAVEAPQASYAAAEPEPARSWYRAPYRSPFDPMFWMEPLGSETATPWLPGISGAVPFALRQPFMAPWLMKAPWEPSSAPERMAADLTNAAFAAYRSAGGYAVAQVVMPPALSALVETPRLLGPAQSTYDTWLKTMFPWLPR